MRQHPVFPDTAVGCTDQDDGNPTLNISARQQIGMFPFCREADS